MRVLIFGGTTEGRRLARALSAMGHQVWVSVATPLGAEELGDLCGDPEHFLVAHPFQPVHLQPLHRSHNPWNQYIRSEITVH
mgnify:CR=1 FL=1